MNELIQSIKTVDRCLESSDFEVIQSLLNCYSKAMSVLEYCDDTTDVSSFEIFQESFKDDLKKPIFGDKSESVAKRILMVLPRIIAKLITLLTNMISRFKKSEKRAEKTAEDIKQTVEDIPEESKEKTIMLNLYYTPNVTGLDYVHEIHKAYDGIQGVVFGAIFTQKDGNTTISKYLEILRNERDLERIAQRLQGIDTLTRLEKRSQTLTADDIARYVESMLDESDEESIDVIIEYMTKDLKEIKSMIEREVSNVDNQNMNPKYAARDRTSSRRKWRFHSPEEIQRVIDFISQIVSQLSEFQAKYWKMKTDDLNELQRGADALIK